MTILIRLETTEF